MLQHNEWCELSFSLIVCELSWFVMEMTLRECVRVRVCEFLTVILESCEYEKRELEASKPFLHHCILPFKRKVAPHITSPPYIIFKARQTSNFAHIPSTFANNYSVNTSGCCSNLAMLH